MDYILLIMRTNYPVPPDRSISIYSNFPAILFANLKITPFRAGHSVKKLASEISRAGESHLVSDSEDSLKVISANRMLFNNILYFRHIMIIDGNNWRKFQDPSYPGG